MSSVFTQGDLQSDTYRWRKSGIGTLAYVFYQTFQLRPNASKQDQWKRFVEDQDGTRIDIDSRCLENFFEKNESSFPGGKVEVVIKRLGTFEETMKKLKDMDAKKAHFERFDCFFFAFLTFSEVDGRLHFNDKKVETGLVPLEKILEVVSGLEVARGKPKIFLIQADDMSLSHPKVLTKGPGKEAKKVKIPTDADRLIIQSNIPQTVVPEKSRESFLIQAFVEVMLNNFNEKKVDLLSLTWEINRSVMDKVNTAQPADLCAPLVTSTLTKLLLLHSDVQLVEEDDGE